MVKLSILIAYYDTYDYTIKLLKELSIQKTNEIEVILIDDGCNEKRFDTFKDFKIIHLKENSGGSHAWNKALEYATGEYIALIDSDDMITMDYIDVLLETLKTHNEDIIYFNWADFNKNEIVRHPSNYALWKAIYKRNIFPRYDETKKANIDVPVQNELRNGNHTEYYIDRVLYIYNSNRVGSITWNNKKMKYVILCDSSKETDLPRQLYLINNERLIDRTIRLLRENGIVDITITAHDKRFNNVDAKIYAPPNNDYDPYTKKSHWLKAYPLEILDEPTCYLYGDVYYSENAIKTIVKEDNDDILYFCAYQNKSPRYIKKWDEPLAFKVHNIEKFKFHIDRLIDMWNKNQTWRRPINWELYRSINNLEVGTHKMTENYIAINDESCDIDTDNDIIKLHKVLGGKFMTRLQATQDFSLERFNEIKITKRANADRDEIGWIYNNDEFECNDDMADYLTGGNDKGLIVAKVLEVIPTIKKNENTISTIEDTTIKEEPKETKKKKRRSKK